MLRANRNQLTSAFLAAVLVLTSYQVGQAASVEDAVTKLSDKISIYLKERDEDSIVLGNFDGPPASSSAVQIKKLLKEKLTDKKIKTVPLGNFGVKGSFKTSNSDGRVTVLLTVQMVDSNNNEVAAFPQRFIEGDPGAGTPPAGTAEIATPGAKKGITEQIDNQGDVATILGTTADLTTDVQQKRVEEKKQGIAEENQTKPTFNTLSEQDQKLANGVKKPSFVLTKGVESAVDSRISASDTSPFRVEVWVKNPQTGQYLPRLVKSLIGFAFLDLEVEEEFGVMVYNDSEFAVAVQLQLDGLNMFEFSNIPERKELGKIVLLPKSRGFVKGWHIDDAVSDAFKVTDLPDSEVAKLGLDTTNIGTVTALFSTAWFGNDVHPQELFKSKSGEAKGIVRGEKVQANYKAVQCFFGKTLLATVSFRYNKPEDDLPADLAP